MGSQRQSLVGPCRGPAGAAAGRGGEGRDRGGGRCAATKRGVYLGRNRGQCAGADAGLAARLRASGPEAAGLGDRARLGAGRRAISGRRRSARIGVTRCRPCGSRTDLRALLDGARRRWCRSCWPTTRPARSSRWRRSPRSSMPRADCCMSMRSRRSEKYRLISMRLDADLVTLSAHKIGGPKGVGARGPGRGAAGARAAAARRRSGAGPPGGHRERCGDCGVWRRREGRHGGAGAGRVRLEGLRDRLESGLAADPRS